MLREGWLLLLWEIVHGRFWLSGILKVLYAIEYGNIFIKGKARILICENCKAQIAIYRTMCNFIYFPGKRGSSFPFEAKNLGNNFWLIVQDNRCKPEMSRRLAREGLHLHCEGRINSSVTVPSTRDSGYVIWEQFCVPGRKRKGNSENHKWKRITDLM